MAKLPSEIRVANQDVVHKFLLLSNSHNGESAVQVKFTPIRVVCNNTLTQALNTGRHRTRARHDRDLGTGLVNVKEALGLIKRRYEFLEQTFGALAAFRLDDSTLMQYLGEGVS